MLPKWFLRAAPKPSVELMLKKEKKKSIFENKVSESNIK